MQTKIGKAKIKQVCRESKKEEKIVLFNMISSTVDKSLNH
jgi:hypothetical protein